MKMEVKAQSDIFYKILDRLVHAPVNLYHDTTPISRILAFFNDDIRGLDSHIFRMGQRFISIQMSLYGNCLITLWAIPHLTIVFAYQFY